MNWNIFVLANALFNIVIIHWSCILDFWLEWIFVSDWNEAFILFLRWRSFSYAYMNDPKYRYKIYNTMTCLLYDKFINGERLIIWQKSEMSNEMHTSWIKVGYHCYLGKCVCFMTEVNFLNSIRMIFSGICLSNFYNKKMIRVVNRNS